MAPLPSRPAPLQRLELELFVRLAGVDRRELARPLASFSSLQQFFTRALAPGARPLEGGDDVLDYPKAKVVRGDAARDLSVRVHGVPAATPLAKVVNRARGRGRVPAASRS